MVLWAMAAEQAAENHGDGMNWAAPDIYDKRYIHKFNSESTHKIQ